MSIRALPTSTTVEITIGYLTYTDKLEQFSSTTVEITIGYLTLDEVHEVVSIYNSRNYYRLLNDDKSGKMGFIYNSRNYYRLLNVDRRIVPAHLSTTVEITIGYLTRREIQRRIYLQQ